MNLNSPLRLTPDNRLALLMHGHLVGGFGKMGLGLLRYSESPVAAVIERDYAGQSLERVTGIRREVPIVSSVFEALALGANTLVIGVATAGGILPPDYLEEILNGLRGGMSLVNGLHAPLAEREEFAALLHPQGFIWDVRKEPPDLKNGTGAARNLSAKRVLTVGTDMAVGKMTASLEMDRAARRRGLRSKFLASGQIGICIAGDGVALDAVRVDFASGAVESLVMRYGADHDILHIEGQGSLLHPASTAWLPLIRGACPTHLVLTHRAHQETVWREKWVKIPPLREVIAAYQSVCAAGGALPPAKVAGIALNCGALNAEEARKAIAQTAEETGIPVTDVVRFGGDTLLDAVLESG